MEVGVKRSKVIQIDFDGTCVEHKYPGVGAGIGAAKVLRDLVENGNKLVLFTMRSNRDSGLADALNWFHRKRIPLWGVQQTPGQTSFTDSPKAYCDLIIDDRALNIPLTHTRSRGSYVDWQETRRLLVDKGYLKI